MRTRQAEVICAKVLTIQGGFYARRYTSETSVYVKVYSSQSENAKPIAILRLSNHPPKQRWNQRITIAKSFHKTETIEEVMSWLTKKLRQLKH